jgi:hypothetical protein
MTTLLRHAPSLSVLASVMQDLFLPSTPVLPLSEPQSPQSPTPLWSGVAQSPGRQESQESQESQGSDVLLDAAEKGVAAEIFVVRVG